MTDHVQAIVIGAGVVGLAVARRLATAGVDVIVLEAADMVGTETSSRNSEVIHAGIYYPTGSLKARLCVEGKHRLYDFCASHGVPHRNCGKLIVATADSENATLEQLQRKARDNDVGDLYMMSAADACALEPELTCTAALMSPSTGIIDSHALMLAYQGEAEDHGAMLAVNSRVLRGAMTNGGFELTVDVGGDERIAIACDMLINAAGLYAQDVGRALAGLARDTVPPQHFCKGSYFSLAGRQPFSRLIYPVPQSASLGVHVTVDLAGQMRFGPDQEWIDDVGYDVDLGRADVFYDAVRRYWPALPEGSLLPAYAGVRPKIQAPDEPARDFLVQGPKDHRVDRLVNLYGIESPGLTASLAIADMVAEALDIA